MKTPRFVLSAVLLALASCSTLEAGLPGGGDRTRLGTFELGQRTFDAASTNCLDEQVAVGLEYATWREDGLFGYEFGVHHHVDRGTLPTVGYTTFQGYEVTAGLRRVQPLEGWAVTPYVGAGLSGWWAARDEATPSARDTEETGLGVYGRIGAMLPVDDHYVIGVDARFLQEDAFQGGQLDLDGNTVTFFVGGFF